jgi:hypothetical protein
VKKKCKQCGLSNYADAVACARCGAELGRPVRNVSLGRPRILVRAMVCLGVCIVMVLGFYVSLIASAESLDIQQKHTVRRAIGVLREKGFAREVALLENITVFRGEDNWLNATVAKENAFAATNFPFAIITLYSDFFTYPTDDVERAAILLHEARHLQGEDEHDAYAYVWANRQQLGWTGDKYAASYVWDNIRRQTREQVPEMFNCPEKSGGDCTEIP